MIMKKMMVVVLGTDDQCQGSMVLGCYGGDDGDDVDDDDDEEDDDDDDKEASWGRTKSVHLSKVLPRQPDFSTKPSSLSLSAAKASTPITTRKS